MKKEQILDKLFALHRFGIKPGLERIQYLCNQLGEPQNTFPIIHIAGTNGKGTVASALASIFCEAGYKTGLYTSPHLIDFNERIRVNKKNISDTEIINIAELLFKFSENREITFFEITTAMAFEYFKRQNVEIAIIETGMGGRFDATNIVQPILSIITSISFEHSEYLGDTIEKIAFEKAGIIKTSVPVVFSDLSENIEKVIIKQAKLNNSAILNAGILSKITNFILKDFASEFDYLYDGEDIVQLRTKILGRHQISNIKIILTAINYLKGKFNINPLHIQDGLLNISENVGWRARLEYIQNEPPIIFDVAHNPEAIVASVNYLNEVYGNEYKWNIIFGVMQDKDISSILKCIKPITAHLLITQANTSRASESKHIQEIALSLGFKNSIVINNPIEAYKYAQKENKATYIFGSFYHIGEILSMLD